MIDNKQQIENLKKEISLIDKKDKYNENLLLNGDFQVNQREFSFFSSEQAGMFAYCVDRWAFDGAYNSYENRKGTIQIDSNHCISLTAFSKGVAFMQKLEQYETNKLKGKTVTLSIKVKEKTGNSPLIFELRDLGLWNHIAVGKIYEPGKFTITTKIPENMVGSLCVYICYDEFVDTSSVKIEWVKLEMGQYATEFSTRPYAEELALCQRYYYKIKTFDNYGLFATGIGRTATVTDLYLNLPYMRTKPNIYCSGLFEIVCPGVNAFPINYFNAGFYTSNYLRIDAYHNSNTSLIGRPVLLTSRDNTDSYIELDAEI